MVDEPVGAMPDVSPVRSNHHTRTDQHRDRTDQHQDRTDQHQDRTDMHQ